MTYLINAIVTAKSETDKILREIALTYEWFFIPVLNPDGFQYTHSVVSNYLYRVQPCSHIKRLKFVLNCGKLLGYI